MRLKEFSIDSPPAEPRPEWMKEKKPSHFTPEKNRETHLDSYLDLITTDTLNLLKINSDEN